MNVTIRASMLATKNIEGGLSYSFLSEYQRREDGGPASTAEGAEVIHKSQARVKQLERYQSSTVSPGSSIAGAETIEITQLEYVKRIQQMQADVVKAWQQNQKVETLRIAIKAVKQLSYTSSAPQMCPLASVLVSDVLGEFERLMFERTKVPASEDVNGQPLPIALGERFSSDEVNIHTKDTCRKWFYKTACIRELQPRIYIEIALLKKLSLSRRWRVSLDRRAFVKHDQDTIVALYTRLYLALASIELVSSSEKTAVLNSLFDYFFAFQQCPRL